MKTEKEILLKIEYYENKILEIEKANKNKRKGNIYYQKIDYFESRKQSLQWVLS